MSGSGLSAKVSEVNQVPFGAVTECYIIEAYEY